MDVKKIIYHTITYCKDILFPMHCLGCDVEGSFVCDICYQTLDMSGVFCCPVCRAQRERGTVCEGCKENSFLDRHSAVMLYQEDGLIGKILHNFKYNFVQDIADVLNKLVKDYVAKEKNDILADLVVPVPLHKRRYAERGFNQAEIVAGFVAKALNISCVQALQRGRYTVQQAKLSREERLKNVVTAFQIVDNARKDIYGKRVILVDDVLTTGSTMQECAKVLKECGVVEVIGVTIARG